jgi:serine/threonine protein kinase
VQFVLSSRDNIPREAIEIGPVIGEGEFGSVFEGRYKSSRGETKNIAIKVINTVEQSQMEDFLQEADVMMKLDHQCVVQLIGMVHCTLST